jgi:hypothetical protein
MANVIHAPSHSKSAVSSRTSILTYGPDGAAPGADPPPLPPLPALAPPLAVASSSRPWLANEPDDDELWELDDELFFFFEAALLPPVLPLPVLPLLLPPLLLLLLPPLLPLLLPPLLLLLLPPLLLPVSLLSLPPLLMSLATEDASASFTHRETLRMPGTALTLMRRNLASLGLTKR